MKVGISFDIYDDFTKYLTPSEDPDYSGPVKELNSRVKKLIEDNDLVITYKGKPLEILPIEENDCSNIFGKEEYREAFWNGVEIYCKLPESEEKDYDKFLLNPLIYPDYFDPIGRVFKRSTT